MATDTQKETYEGWSILELMGHRRLGGYVREQEIAGAAFLRIDIPAVSNFPASTQFYPPASLYCLTPTTEEIAKAVAAKNHPEPVQRWELPAPSKVASEEVTDESGDEFEDDDDEIDGTMGRHGDDCPRSACEADKKAIP